MSEWKPVALTVKPGRVRVNAGSIMRSGPGVAALHIDLHSKYAGVSAVGSGGPDDAPCVYLEATASTLHVDESQPEDALTELAFPEFLGWSVHSVWIGRYTLSVCLVSPEPAL